MRARTCNIIRCMSKRYTIQSKQATTKRARRFDAPKGAQMNRRFRRTEQRVRPTLTNWSVADVAAWAEDSDGELRRVERSIPNSMLFIEPKTNSSNQPGYVLHKCLSFWLQTNRSILVVSISPDGSDSPLAGTADADYRYRALVVLLARRVYHTLAHLANSHANATQNCSTTSGKNYLFICARSCACSDTVHASIAHCRFQFRVWNTIQALTNRVDTGQQAALHSIEGKNYIVLSTHTYAQRRHPRLSIVYNGTRR